ncbi:MAG: ATP synthase F0 subunit C [Candidatus Hydrogenedens sp.]
MGIHTWYNMLDFVFVQTAETAQQNSAIPITGEDLRVIFACISAGLTIAVAGLGAALSEGYAAGKACEGVARNPEATGLVTRTMIIGQAVTESVVIYALVIAIIILFFMV